MGDHLFLKKMKQVTLKIDGMKCYMCEDHITNNIRKAIPDAKKVKASHKQGQASFVIDESQDYQGAIESIEKEGYHVLDAYSSIYEKKGLFSFFKK